MNAARFLLGARTTRRRWLLITTTANTSTGGSPLSAQCSCAPRERRAHAVFRELLRFLHRELRLVLRPATVRARDESLELRAQPRPLRLHHATRLPVHRREPRAEQRVQPEDFFEGSGRHEEQVFGLFTPEGTRPARGLGGGHAGSSRRRIPR